MMTSDVLNTIYNMRQINKEDNEAGGMLIGSIIRNTHDIVINDLTVPVDDDYRTRSKYIRNEIHNQLLERKWIESQHTKMYLGEWHTHPQRYPQYSSQDLKNWSELIKKAQTESKVLFFLIAGTCGYKVWKGSRSRNQILLIFEDDFSKDFESNDS